MNKLKLDVDALDVESFEAEPGAETRGTVRAAEHTPDGSCDYSCDGSPSCVYTGSPCQIC